jgi:hydroxymethylbilane synthase
MNTDTNVNSNPGSGRKIIIGTRGSDLALKQVHIVGEALRMIDSTIVIEVRIITTRGDVNQGPIPVDVVGKGWFTREIEQELLKGGIDIAVHSLKDMAQEMPTGLIIAAYPSREDSSDALITKNGESLENLKQGAVIGTDSIRRQVQMKALRPDAEMKSIRGNVPTRIQKLESEPYDAIILASAGLKRLGLEKKIVYNFKPNEMTPAPGQGILAIQARESDSEIRKILDFINDKDTEQIALIERSFSEKIGGGCKSPVGAHAYKEGSEYRLMGMIASKDNKKIIRQELSAPEGKHQNLGIELAENILNVLDK